VEDLLQQVPELQEMVRRSCNIREAEKEICNWFQVQSAVDLQPMAKQPKTPPLAHTEGRGEQIMQKNGSLQWQGPAGGRDFPRSLRCPGKTASPLCRQKRGELLTRGSYQGCHQETTKPCTVHWLLSAAVVSCGHQQHRQEQPE